MKVPARRRTAFIMRSRAAGLDVNPRRAAETAWGICVKAMTQPTVLMLGVGDYDKHSDFTPLFEAFGSTVKGVIASGINIPAIKAAAEKAGYKGEFVEWYGNFEGMIKKAGEMAGKGSTVLLSPAAASWGQFDNYEQRGEIFKDIVNKL